MWVYLLLVLVLCINLLIAMFNQRYQIVMSNAQQVQKMINVSSFQLATPPVACTVPLLTSRADVACWLDVRRCVA